MKKGNVLLGTMIAFRYITVKDSGVTFCLVTVEDSTKNQYKVLLGTRDSYPISAVMEMKKAGCQIKAVCEGTVKGELRFKDAETTF